MNFSTIRKIHCCNLRYLALLRNGSCLEMNGMNVSMEKGEAFQYKIPINGKNKCTDK